MKAMLYLDQMGEPVAVLDDVKVVEFGSDNHPGRRASPNLLSNCEPERDENDGRTPP